MQIFYEERENGFAFADSDCFYGGPVLEVWRIPASYYGTDCPLDKDKVGERVYMDILNRAQNYVHIMSPYLILDSEMEAALKFAAERACIAVARHMKKWSGGPFLKSDCLAGILISQRYHCVDATFCLCKYIIG